MDTNTNDQAAINKVHINSNPSLSEESNEQEQPAINKVDAGEEPLTEQNNPSGKKKYHSSAMYAANAWHSTMKHVKQHHNHIGLNW